MSARHLVLAAAAFGLAGAAGANAAVVSFAPGQALTSVPFLVSFGGGADYAFSAAATANGPGAAVATSGTATVTSFFGEVTDFSAGSSIDQNGQLYGFSAFSTAAVIPFSAANDFIGLAFTLSDGLHYGYAEVTGPTLVSYAFETTPGVSILTGATATAVPEPASIALLLIGISGAMFVQRRSSYPT